MYQHSCWKRGSVGFSVLHPQRRMKAFIEKMSVWVYVKNLRALELWLCWWRRGDGAFSPTFMYTQPPTTLQPPPSWMNTQVLPSCNRASKQYCLSSQYAVLRHLLLHLTKQCNFHLQCAEWIWNNNTSRTIHLLPWLIT